MAAPLPVIDARLMPTPRIVIFNDTHGWHSEQLRTAFMQVGASVIFADLADCTLDLDHPDGIQIPGCDKTLPDAVIVRGIAPGTLEQITLRLDILHTLAERGVFVMNSARAIEHTVDKARTSLRLHLSGLNTPRTWACESKETAYAIAKTQFSQGKTLVIKPLFGCQGKGIEKINTLTQLDYTAITGGVFYLQEYIAPFQSQYWQDWRLMVIGHQVCAAMSRQSQHWITNFAQGAQCVAATVTPEMAQLAIHATQAVGADYAGVDLIRQADGRFSVLEVNSVPAWKGLQQATDLPIAEYLAQAVIKRIQSQHTSHPISDAQSNSN